MDGVVFVVGMGHQQMGSAAPFTAAGQRDQHGCRQKAV